MDRPNLGQGYVPSHWIEYADWLEAERDKLREALVLIHDSEKCRGYFNCRIAAGKALDGGDDA
jgi:hypothetical protein